MFTRWIGWHSNARIFPTTVHFTACRAALISRERLQYGDFPIDKSFRSDKKMLRNVEDHRLVPPHDFGEAGFDDLPRLIRGGALCHGQDSLPASLIYT